jgi:4-diphosphocytidyl-2-C-methyl-D-erythritol kinase
VLARDVPADESNLVVRAVAALAAEAGIEPALDIELGKRIPSGAGLGGGSSDAAAALAAVAEAWALDWPRERLAVIGARIGSDVPWFFAGGAAVATGRGERIVAVAPLCSLFAVIACPPQGLSTAAVYQACVPSRARAGEAVALAAALAAGDLGAALPLLANDLEPPARRLSPAVDRHLAQAGGLCPRLTGSGSACFTLCRTLAEAQGIAARLAALDDDGRPRWPLVAAVRVGGKSRG